MRSIKLIFLITVLLSGKSIYGQMDFSPFGAFSTEEITMKQCSFDTEADAIILLDKAVSNYDDDIRLSTRRRIRIKILTAKAFEKADIIIPFYSKDNFESVGNIKAATYNFEADGKPSSTQVDKKLIFIKKENENWSSVKFAMPAIKVGSIIEYEYETSTRKFAMPDDWFFQDEDMATLKSSYLVEVPPSAEFRYKFQRTKELPLVIKPLPDQGMIYFEMSNIPALRFEPYMDSPKDYFQKVFFQLSGVMNHAGDKQDINTTWKSFAFDLMTERYFGSQLDKDLKIDDLKNLLQSESTETGKLKTIYKYVQKNIQLSRPTQIYAPDGIAVVLDRKKGSPSEMNLLLINLLQAYGIEVYPLLVAERDFGKVDTTFPYKNQFNKTVAFAIADGKQYVLDASLENCPVGLTPYPLLGTTAFLVDKKIFSLIKIGSGNKYFKNVIDVNGELDTKGSLTAIAKTQSYDYARQSVLDRIKSDKRKFISNTFEKPYEGLAVDSFLIKNEENDTLALEQIVPFKQQLNQTSGFTFLNANFFTGLEKNPFTSSIRFTNVNFGYPYDVSVHETIKVPAGTTVELPELKILKSNDNTIQATKQILFENNEITVVIRFIQTTTLVKTENYSAIKDFYKQMVGMLNEPVLIKMKE